VYENIQTIWTGATIPYVAQNITSLMTEASLLRKNKTNQWNSFLEYNNPKKNEFRKRE
jgi:hypothetical protein